VLSPELADQIAAGEVVERPASVVKELVENSLDAGARRVEISFERGGRSLISVVDDGHGMAPDEVGLALLRHATSKLHSAEQLMSLRTMGFRGEALPSIAAVSRLAITSRTANAAEGAQVSIEASRTVDVRAAGCAVGTQVAVRDLLYNVPARLKFLKTEATEAGQITETVVRLAVAHPEVHFRLVRDGRELLDLPRVSSRLERAKAALARQGGAQLVEVEGASREEGLLAALEGDVRMQALLGPPSSAVTTARNTYLFVGRRYVRDRGLLSAVVAGYGELLVGGRYPFALVFLDTPDGEVDINVHPQKLEVRLARPAELHQLVRRTVRRRLAQGPWATSAPATYQYGEDTHPLGPSSGWGGRAQELGQGGSQPLALRGPAGLGGLAADRRGVGALRAPEPFRGAPGEGPGGPPPSLRPPWESDGGVHEPSSAAPKARRPGPAGAPWAPAESPGLLERQVPPQVGRFRQLRYLGQLDRTFLVCEGERELVLIDQHAAHERVVFDRLQRGFLERRAPSQRLLVPQVVELSVVEQATVEEHGDALSAVGFELRPFGGGSWALTATPVLPVGRDAVELLRDVLAELADEVLGTERTAADVKLLATVACHSSLRSGDAVDPLEVEALLKALDELSGPPSCPHGRPVAVRMATPELARRFGRSA
jgi:DNA mismatch repair protein MutL